MLVIQEMMLQHLKIKVALHKTTHLTSCELLLISSVLFHSTYHHNHHTNESNIKHCKRSPGISEGGLDNVYMDGQWVERRSPTPAAAAAADASRLLLPQWARRGDC